MVPRLPGGKNPIARMTTNSKWNSTLFLKGPIQKKVGFLKAHKVAISLKYGVAW